MSKEEHYKFCGQHNELDEKRVENAKKDVREGIHEEFKLFKEYFDVEMENKVLRQLKNLNGTLEQKIADVVSAQVNILGKELTKQIGEKLDLVEVVKHLAIKEKR